MSIISSLTQIRDLPVLPEIVFRIQSLVSSDTAASSELAALIEQDSSLTANLLRMANSALFGIPGQRITSIATAISRVGFNEIRNLSMFASLIRTMPRTSMLLDYHGFWRHALLTAQIAKSLTTICYKGKKEWHMQAYTAGLLHDIGILLLDQFFHEQFDEVVSTAIHKQENYLTTESLRLSGEGHAAIGAVLMEMWKLDNDLVNAVRWHHDPSKAPERYAPFCAIVACAESLVLTRTLGTFEGIPGPQAPLCADCFCQNGEIDEIMMKAAESVQSSQVLIRPAPDSHTPFAAI